MVRPGCSRPATLWRWRYSQGWHDAEVKAHSAHGIATELQIAGRSRMTKEQLVEAIEKANAAATRKRS